MTELHDKTHIQICPQAAEQMKHISSLYGTHNKNIWIGTDEGIYIYAYATEDFNTYFVPGTTPNNVRIEPAYVNHIVAR